MVKSIGEALADTASVLRKADIRGCELEARELVCHACGVHRDHPFLHPEYMLGDRELEKLASNLQRRLSGCPIQYILGSWDFYGLELEVNENTLIPRSDTEVLVEEALSLLKGKDSGRILDLGCGSGCIGIAMLKNLPKGFSCVFADISRDALAVTKKNILRHKLFGRGTAVIHDMREPFPTLLGSFDMILSNPPYLTAGDMDVLQTEVKHEPALALYGGPDGLDFYRAISKNALSVLNNGGYVLCEVGMGQHTDVEDIFRSAGYADIGSKKDLSGIYRVVKSRKV